MLDLFSELKGIAHVGYVVNDLKMNIEKYENVLGITDFAAYDFSPLRAWVYGKKISNCKLKIAMGTTKNGVKIELIEPVAGNKTYHAKTLVEKGPCIDHVGFLVDNYEKWREYFIVELKTSIVFEAEAYDEIRGYRRCFYASLGDAVGIVEIVEVAKK